LAHPLFLFWPFVATSSSDAFSRVTRAVCLLTNLPGFATVQYGIDYAFDPVGNVTNRLIAGLQRAYCNGPRFLLQCGA
jgi:hypothetical protein